MDKAFLDALTQAPLRPEYWPEALRILAGNFGFQVVAAFLRDQDASDQFGLMFGARFGEGPDGKAYREHYWKVDHGREAIEQESVGTIHTGDHPTRKVRNTELEDYFRHSPVAAGSGFGAIAFRDKSVLGVISAAMPAGTRRVVGPHDVRLLKPYLGHVRNAMTTQLALTTLRLTDVARGAAPEGSNNAVAIVHADGRLRHANEEGLRLYVRSSPSFMHRGLFVGPPSIRSAMASAITAATDPCSPRCTWLTLTNDGGPTVRLTICPLHLGGTVSVPMALVVGHELESGGVPRERIAEYLRGKSVTAAELRVAMLLWDGVPPKVIATRLRVGVATVRTQLSSILHKVGASRQLDLVHRLTQIAERELH